MDSQEKRKNHYVSQFYLKEWSADKEWINVEIGGNAPRRMRIEEIAYANYFYKVLPISSAVAQRLRGEAKLLLPPLISSHVNAVIDYAHALWAARELGPPNFQELDSRSTHVIEDFFLAIEDCFQDALTRLRDRDIANLSLADYDNIVRFVVYQVGRTVAAAKRIEGGIGELLGKLDVEFDSYHRISNLIICGQIHAALVNKLYRLVLIVNSTDEPFITTDDPAINLNRIGDPDARFFMPLSPCLAIEICANPIDAAQRALLMDALKQTLKLNSQMVSERRVADIAEIKALNRQLRSKAHRFVFVAG